jgi:hypothetical protein
LCSQSSQAVISLVENATEIPAEKPTIRVITSARRPREKWTNQDLPYGTYRSWSNVFIPTYLAFVGAQRNPFTITSEELVGAMQEAWDLIYPSTPYEIKPRTAVFDLVNSQFLH